jgi:hypothetical protein
MHCAVTNIKKNIQTQSSDSGEQEEACERPSLLPKLEEITKTKNQKSTLTLKSCGRRHLKELNSRGMSSAKVTKNGGWPSPGFS